MKMRTTAVTWPQIVGRLLVLTYFLAVGACAPTGGGPGVYSPPAPEFAGPPHPFVRWPSRRHHGGGGPSRPGPFLSSPVEPATTQNAYELLLKRGGEHCDPGQSCYAIYTYVILPRTVGGDMLGTDAQVRERYEALLHAILTLSHAATELAAAGASKDETNIFLIPAVHPSVSSLLDNYSWQLGLQYLVLAESIISRAPADKDKWRKFAQQIAMEPGPFLVSTPVPMDQLGDKSALLISDLSKYQPGAMEQLVAEYERRIASGTSDTVVLFNPLKVRLLSAAEYANASIEIELVALARLPHGE